MINLNRNQAKKIQNGQLKPPPKAEQFSPNFHKLVLGWVGSIDAKGIHFAQPTSDSLMTIELSDIDALRIIYPTDPRTNPVQFRKYWELTVLSWPFWTFFFKKIFFLLHFYENPSKVLGYQGWDKILIILIPSQISEPTPNISAASVIASKIRWRVFV